MDDQLYTQVVATDYGTYLVTADQESIIRLALVSMLDAELLPRANPSPLTREATSQLLSYFRGELLQFDLPLRQSGTQFQQQVWDYLHTIPYGETRSYGDLAKSINNPRAVRAVGAANGSNQIPIIVPCHRVIASNGKLQGYALGIDLKRRFLDLERSKNPQFLF